MRDLFPSLKKFSLVAALGMAFGLLAFGQTAQAANLFEKNFWLSGPRYDGNLPPCEWALGKISSRFADKESTFWNSTLQITVAPAMRGRVASLDWLASTALTPLSFAITGPLAAAYGASTVLLWGGLIAGLLTLAMLYVIPGLRAEDGGLARAEAEAAAAAQASSEAMSLANAG